jgi:hypothetical protein
VVVVPIIILQVAVFTSFWSQRVSERNMFCVFPIVLIGLALWFDAQLPRPRRVAALAAAIAGVLALSVPYGYLYPLAPSTETWAIVLPQILTRHLAMQGWDVQVLIAVGVAIALAAFGVLRTRAAVALIPILLVGYFAVSAGSAVHEVARAAADYRNAPSLGADADWLDRNVPAGATVALVTGSSLGPDTDRLIAWQTSFFNKTPFTWLAWGANLVADPLTGRVTGPDGAALTLPPYVVAPSSTRFSGPLVVTRGPYSLQTPTAPYQLDFATSGIFDDGWAASTSTIDVYQATAGSTLHVHLDRTDVPSAVPPATVVIRFGPLKRGADGTVGIGASSPSVTGAVASGGAFEQDLPTPDVPFRVEISVTPAFVPAAFGGTDTRELGARITASYGSWTVAG